MTNREPSIRIIVRADDMGMTHASNVAIARCFEEGILTCAGIQAVAPWAEEACALFKEVADRESENNFLRFMLDVIVETCP